MLMDVGRPDAASCRLCHRRCSRSWCSGCLVDDVPNRWTYVSLSAHEVVGSSSLGDTHEDALWMLRTDWDIAFCNGMIRTNSGSSGKGKGGITWTPVDYDDIENLRAPSYQTDTRQTVTVKSVEIE